MATDIDVLPADRELVRRPGYWVVRSPSNPGHFFGNLLVFDAPPRAGDRERWLQSFRSELPGLAHRTLAWDTTDGALGAARDEFEDFRLERLVGLTAAAGEIRAHPRADQRVSVRRVDLDDPVSRAAVTGIWSAQNAASDDPHPASAHGVYAAARLAELAELFRGGRGAWFGAYLADELVGSLGVVVTGGRARFQNVDVLGAHRGRGIASRLVVEAARSIAAAHSVDSFVIAADADYHALGIYESVGFRRAELACAVWRWPAPAHGSSASGPPCLESGR